MFPNPYRSDRRDIFWIVGISHLWRHATEVLPGARPSGDWIPTLCEEWIRVPFPTPPGLRPESRDIDAQCPQCIEVAEQRECSGVLWDF